MSNPVNVLDVSDLPTSAFDARSPVWWGNTLFMVIETTTLALLVVSYFYSWQYDPQWPPPQSNRGTASPNPYPRLGLATLDVLLTVVSLVPAVWLDLCARRFDARRVSWGLSALFVLGCVLITFRFLEFPALGFRWDDNAYASLVWAMLGLHLTYLIAAVAENAATLVWVLRYGVDEHRAVDVTLTVAYWYWACGVWVVLYGVVYWAPRLR
jgi:cytochrome c oxidase subunit 3